MTEQEKWTRRFIAATRNGNKLSEIRGALGEAVDVVKCPDEVPEVDEPEPTLLGNARLKAIDALAIPFGPEPIVNVIEEVAGRRA